MRTIEEILFTGAYNSDESRRLREAGYVWKSCLWCRVVTYTMLGLCERCAKAGRTAKEPVL